MEVGATDMAVTSSAGAHVGSSETSVNNIVSRIVMLKGLLSDFLHDRTGNIFSRLMFYSFVGTDE
jgi:hypothetical protein